MEVNFNPNAPGVFLLGQVILVYNRSQNQTPAPPPNDGSGERGDGAGSTSGSQGYGPQAPDFSPVFLGPPKVYVSGPCPAGIPHVSPHFTIPQVQVLPCHLAPPNPDWHRYANPNPNLFPHYFNGASTEYSGQIDGNNPSANHAPHSVGPSDSTSSCFGGDYNSYTAAGNVKISVNEPSGHFDFTLNNSTSGVAPTTANFIGSEKGGSGGREPSNTSNTMQMSNTPNRIEGGTTGPKYDYTKDPPSSDTRVPVETSTSGPAGDRNNLLNPNAKEFYPICTSTRATTVISTEKLMDNCGNGYSVAATFQEPSSQI